MTNWKKILRRLDRDIQENVGPVYSIAHNTLGYLNPSYVGSLSGQEFIDERKAQLESNLSKSQPHTTALGTYQFVRLAQDVKATRDVIKLGFIAIFTLTKPDGTVTEFKGSAFYPVRYIQHSSRSKYMPHQGKKECARRVSQRTSAAICIGDIAEFIKMHKPGTLVPKLENLIPPSHQEK